ncbi:MAG: gamma-butyrobetaine dioxygenase [Pseudomonadota bacterium]
MQIESLSLIDQGDALAVTWPDGQVSRFHAVWLRDNALDADSRDANNGQRLISILDVPADSRIESAKVVGDGVVQLQMSPGAKQLAFPSAWLREHSYDQQDNAAACWMPSEVTTWDGALLPEVPHGDYQALQSNRDALGQWLSQVREYGVASMSNVPCEPGSVCQVAELFGYVRETNYGRYFDVKSEVDPINLAYTGLGLQAHTDNPYRDPVPTLQLLGCLKNTAEGGESIVVDGFRAVQRLGEEAPEMLEILSRYPARFCFAGDSEVNLRSRQPMIDIAADGCLNAVRFNNRSIAPVVDVPFDHLADYYAAYRKFAEIITDPAMQISFKLQAGDLFIVNNRRVLHSRLAFSGAGTRWLQGCYADLDGLYSTLRVIEQQVSG